MGVFTRHIDSCGAAASEIGIEEEASIADRQLPRRPGDLAAGKLQRRELVPGNGGLASAAAAAACVLDETSRTATRAFPALAVQPPFGASAR